MSTINLTIRLCVAVGSISPTKFSTSPLVPHHPSTLFVHFLHPQNHPNFVPDFGPRFERGFSPIAILGRLPSPFSTPIKPRGFSAEFCPVFVTGFSAFGGQKSGGAVSKCSFFLPPSDHEQNHPSHFHPESSPRADTAPVLGLPFVSNFGCG